jgi:hypothetical protein
MADTAGYPTDAKLDSHNAHTNKRKRDTRDQGLNRPAPNTNATMTADEVTANFLAAHNAGNDDDMSQQFDVHQNGSNTASVGDTAAAALAYHQMTVPQATELQFQTQGSGGDSFSMSDHHQQQTGMQDFSLEALKAATQTGRAGQSAQSESPPQSGSSHKPTVGSEEWHKVRRDNHKEGRHFQSCTFGMTNMTQLNAADAKLSTRASTSWPKSSQAAKRTRVQSCNVPFSLSLN